MLLGECTFQLIVTCPDCGHEMPLRVLSSGAGYYLGHTCIECGPWDRITHYYKKQEDAVKDLHRAQFEGFDAVLNIRTY
jgi:uncharacterized Zn finger protein